MQLLHSSSCFRSAGLRNDSDISIARRIRPVSCSKLDRTRSGNCITPQRAQISTRHVQVAAAVAAPDQAPEAEQAAELQDIPSVLGAAAVEEPTVLAFDVPRLADLQLQAIINPEGFVSPEVEPGTAAAVFAVYDQLQKLQYIGFSKDLRGSLKTVLGRRPDKAYYFKATQLAAVDQDVMLNIRQAWFDECGAPPPGNKLALERKAWQSAVDAGAISARAKPGAAAEKLKELLEVLRKRGCQEEFIADPELLQNGQVDFLSSAGKQKQQQQDRGEHGDSQAGLESSDASTEASSSSSNGSNGGSGDGSTSVVRTATAVVDGQAKQFSVEYMMKYATKGGYMFDVKVSFDHMDTVHRIIVSKQYYEQYGIAPESPVEATIALMLARKMPRHNEGMLGTAEFPVNYYTVSEFEQWFDEEFAAQFLRTTGHALIDGTDLFWRMNKIHDYGSKLEDPSSFGNAMSQQGLGRM